MRERASDCKKASFPFSLWGSLAICCAKSITGWGASYLFSTRYQEISLLNLASASRSPSSIDALAFKKIFTRALLYRISSVVKIVSICFTHSVTSLFFNIAKLLSKVFIVVSSSINRSTVHDWLDRLMLLYHSSRCRCF